MATCKSCKAEIVWAVTEAGKKVPLDAKPVTGFVLLEHPALEDQHLAVAEKIHVSHFATCPNADQHRRSS